VLCSGTWLNSDDGTKNGQLPNPSNVTRLSRAIKAESDDGIQQVVYYHYGVGSQGGKLFLAESMLMLGKSSLTCFSGMIDRVVMGKSISYIALYST
jgi:uncharacterized protein (DUF2235 family)